VTFWWLLFLGELAMKLAIAASIAVMLSVGSALAGAGAPVPEKPEGGPPSGRPGAVLDADKCKAVWSVTEGDTLSQDKAAPFIVNFEMVDTSKDGKISQEEFNDGCAKGLVQEQASKPAESGGGQTPEQPTKE
jgi:hypothetical protein